MTILELHALCPEAAVEIDMIQEDLSEHTLRGMADNPRLGYILECTRCRERGLHIRPDCRCWWWCEPGGKLNPRWRKIVARVSRT